MADSPNSNQVPQTEEARESKTLDMNFELRLVINQALGAVQGRQTSQSFAAITYEELAEQQIARIKDPGTTARPNELERINKIEADLISAVEKVRTIPPEQFILKDERRDVNTPVVPTGR